MSFATGLLGRAVTALILSFVLFVNGATARTNHALLVAVSQYPNLDKDLWLSGPKNDAKLVRNFLLANRLVKFDESNVITLADGVDDADLPTLANIRQAVIDLEKNLQSGDFVYLHFSGHGSQAPALKPDQELDGLDELFLPADTGAWNKSVGTVENALVDDEIGSLIDRLRKKGATVWAVFDSCHSGTVTRAVSTGDSRDRGTPRKLTASALKIPDDRWLDARRTTTRSVGDSSVKAEPAALDQPQASNQTDGGFIAFYAAQTNETTPEMRLPEGAPDRVTHGLFTYTLFEALAQFPGLTYRQLGQEVLRRYSINYVAQPTPLFTGDLDGGVFGLEGVKAIRQWPLVQGSEGLTVGAGRIHGLSVGDELLLLNSPADGNDDAVARVRIDDVQSLSSTVSIAGDAFVVIPDFAHARQVAKSLNFGLTVARPETAALKPELRQLVEATLDHLEKEENSGLRLQLVAPGEPADLQFATPTAEELAALADSSSSKAPRGTHLWMLPPSGEIKLQEPAKSFSIALTTPGSDAGPLRSPKEVATILSDSLTSIARATNLLKLGDISNPADLDLDVQIRTRKKKGKPFRTLDNAAVAKLVPGDEVHLIAKNSSAYTLDLNVLYLGSDYSIGFMYKGRIHSGGTLKKGLLHINNKSFGREKLLLIATKAPPQSALTDLSWLTQAALQRTRAGPGKKSGFISLLRQSGFGTTTRTATPMSDDEDESAGSIAQLNILTAPSH